MNINHLMKMKKPLMIEILNLFKVINTILKFFSVS